MIWRLIATRIEAAILSRTHTPHHLADAGSETVRPAGLSGSPFRTRPCQVVRQTRFLRLASRSRSWWRSRLRGTAGLIQRSTGRAERRNAGFRSDLVRRSGNPSRPESLPADRPRWPVSMALEIHTCKPRSLVSSPSKGRSPRARRCTPRLLGTTYNLRRRTTSLASSWLINTGLRKQFPVWRRRYGSNRFFRSPTRTWETP